LGQALLQVVLEELFVVDLAGQGGEWRLRFQLPAYRVRGAVGVHQAEGIDAVVLGAGEAVAGFVACRPLAKCRALRVGGEKCLQLCRVWLASGRIWRTGQHLVVEALRCADRQHGRVVHAGTPDLAVIGTQLDCQAAHRYAGVRGERVGTADGEAADHRHSRLAESPCCRQARGLATGLEVAADVQALGVVLAIPRVVPGLGFEGIDDALWRQLRPAYPACGIGEAGAQRQQHGADAGQAQRLGRALQG